MILEGNNADKYLRRGLSFSKLAGIERRRVLFSFPHHNQLSFCLAQVQGSCDQLQS